MQGNYRLSFFSGIRVLSQHLCYCEQFGEYGNCHTDLLALSCNTLYDPFFRALLCLKGLLPSEQTYIGLGCTVRQLSNSTEKNDFI